MESPPTLVKNHQPECEKGKATPLNGGEGVADAVGQEAGDFLRACCQRRMTRQPWRRCINRPASARVEPRPVFPTW